MNSKLKDTEERLSDLEDRIIQTPDQNSRHNTNEKKRKRKKERKDQHRRSMG